MLRAIQILVSAFVLPPAWQVWLRPARPTVSAHRGRSPAARHPAADIDPGTATPRPLPPLLRLPHDDIPFLPGAPHIAYRDNALYVEDQRVDDLAEQHGTPLFVYSTAAMREALAAYQRGFAGRKLHICYAMKANSAGAAAVLCPPGADSTSSRVANLNASSLQAATPPK